VENDEELPDLTVPVPLRRRLGHVQVGGILRKVGYELRAEDSDDDWTQGSETGWGLNVGTCSTCSTRMRSGCRSCTARASPATMNDGGMDLAPSAQYDEDALSDLEAEAVPLTGVLAYYDHWWSDRWSSSIGYSYTEVDNTNFQDPGAFNKGEYASGNLLYYPGENLMIGGELMWGQRTVNDDESDDDLRFQFSVKYNFGIKPLTGRRGMITNNRASILTTAALRPCCRWRRSPYSRAVRHRIRR